MNSFIKYPLVLGIVTALSGSALYATFKGTEKNIAEQEAAAKVKALGNIFTDGYGAVEEIEKGGISFSKVWKSEDKNGSPDYYVTTGQGIGYNTAVPITLLVGFEAQKKEGKGRVMLGWSVVKSEETPGLGEKAKDRAAPYTIVGKLTGKAGAPPKDKRTAFQKQFYDPANNKVYTAKELILKKEGGEIDIITGATISTRAIIKAIEDASAKIDKAVD
ncbi:MAG: FMN-binding protein [Planctomycetota bacterium]|jgi:RnfABCDGE-type electron transport complex G subunit